MMASNSSDITFIQINKILAMDIDKAAPIPNKRYIVLDTNTLIGNLTLVQSLADRIDTSALPITILIPGIVIAELDSLKQGFKDSAWRSRVASKWILKKFLQRESQSQVQSHPGNACVRGQTFTETCLRSGNWRKRSKGYEEETNDDLVLDCASYFSKDDAKVWVWSGDVQLCAKSIVQSLLVLYDQESLAVDVMLRAVLEGQSISPRHSVQPRNEYLFPMYSHSVSRVQNEDDMDMDIEYTNNPRPADHDHEMRTANIQHPLDELHEQVVAHFTDLLRDIAQRAAVAQAEWNARAGSGLLASRHAPKFGEAVQTLPAVTEISKFTCSECIQFLSVLSAQVFLSNGVQINQTDKPEHYELVRLANFLTPPYNPGSRRGRDWTRGDWRDALSLLEKSARYWQDASTYESCTVCRPVMENIFHGLET